MKRLALLSLPFLVFGLIMAAAEIAHAKRFGGGGSFGSKPSYSRPASRPAPSQNLNRQSTTNQAVPGSRGFGGMGIFGGLLAGTLLGSLLFGGGFGGFGMFDMLLLGLGIFFLMRFLRSRRPRESMSEAGAGPSIRSPQYGQNSQYRSADTSWDNLSSSPRRPMGPMDGDGQPVVNTPAGFDVDDFLKGAKVVYSRLQQSWDARDLQDIREFTTDAVFDEIRAQAQESPEPSKTEVLLINARLLEAKQEGTITHATVYYDVMMREDPTINATAQVREVWHFVRDSRDAGDMWKLDGIQQLED